MLFILSLVMVVIAGCVGVESKPIVVKENFYHEGEQYFLVKSEDVYILVPYHKGDFE